MRPERLGLASTSVDPAPSIAVQPRRVLAEHGGDPMPVATGISRFAHDFSGLKVRPSAPPRERGGPEEGEEAVGVGERIGRAVRRAICFLGETKDPAIGPLTDMSTLQSPGPSGWRGAKFGRYRNGCTRMHRGWDIHAVAGTPVRAVVTGRMTRGNEAGGLGQFATLTSSADRNRAYRYAHLSRRAPAGSYCVGEELGATGTTGNADATRPHLHFEVRENGAAIDPQPFLTEPSQVIEATGSTATAINHAEPDPCP